MKAPKTDFKKLAESFKKAAKELKNIVVFFSSFAALFEAPVLSEQNIFLYLAIPEIQTFRLQIIYLIPDYRI